MWRYIKPIYFIIETKRNSIHNLPPIYNISQVNKKKFEGKKYQKSKGYD